MGLSQNKLGIAMGVTQVSIARWEAGSVRLTPRTMKHLKLLALHDSMLDAIKIQHAALDFLMARLALLDRDFLPSKCGPPWEAMVQGNEAIKRAEG
jgi:transcriptional regulator with XRE-family HTH domain